MSFRIFGAVATSDAQNTRRFLTEAARKEGFEIQTAFSPTPDLAGFFKNRADPNSIPVFINAAGDSDHAEGFLFLPGESYSSVQSRNHLKANLQKLQAVFQECAKQNLMSSADLVFSSSPDVAHRHTECSVSEVAEIAYQELRKENWFADFSLGFS